MKDVKKITTENEITYELDAEKGSAEWKVIFDPAGTALGKARGVNISTASF